MYFLLNIGIFRPVMLVFRGVKPPNKIVERLEKQRTSLITTQVGAILDRHRKKAPKKIPPWLTFFQYQLKWIQSTSVQNTWQD